MYTRKSSIAILAFLFTGMLTHADDTVPLNEEYKGKTVKVDKGPGPGLAQPMYSLDTVSIELTSGHKLELSVRAFGDGRKIAVGLFNSDGEMVAASWPIRKMGNRPITKGVVGGAVGYSIGWSPKTAQLVVGEIPGNGTYTIIVYCDSSGDYSLLAKDPTKKKRDVATVQAELTATKRRVEELEKELKQLQDKSKDK